MAKEQFAYRETKELLKTLDQAAHASGVSRGQAFEDFLHMGVCALAGGALEEQYLAVVQKHTAGQPGIRGCDRLAQLFGALVHAMEETRRDILGDLFQGASTYGEAGQFFTPDAVTQLMTDLVLPSPADSGDAERKTVCDPCCGSGRMLLAVAARQPHWEFVGQDIDLRCVRMTALNLALRNLYGHVIWGDSLRAEQRLVYRTGFNGRGFLREMALADCPPAVQAVDLNDSLLIEQASHSEPPRPARQLRFF